ncbi:MAG TPA: hypothetical protein VFT43_06755, partial [Candidatus Polarisedimenticolia bacterium]|nr:hypothetical protein [Candidatus Polarisedimenticolia bacterium]
MPTLPIARVVTVAYGPLPRARSLNPRFSPGRPLLMATVDIEWRPDDPLATVARLEQRLLHLSPRFARHECRGLERYHVFARARPSSPEASGSGTARPGADASPNDGPDSFEAALALAHLIEHAVIEFQCTITGERRCSGATAARRSPAGRFDLLVESLDPLVGRCCLTLALTWLTAVAGGHDLDPEPAEVLSAARLAYRRRGGPILAPDLARAIRWSEARAARALTALSAAGYLVERP